MANLIQIGEKRKKLTKLRTYLFKCCQEGIDAKSLAESEIGKELELDWQMAKRYLDEIERENLLHAKKFGNTIVYTPNGKKVGNEHPHKIQISSHMDLYLDNFPGPYGKPFMRIAQKRDGQMVGSIIVPLEKIEEFSKKFSKLSTQLSKIKKETEN